MEFYTLHSNNWRPQHKKSVSDAVAAGDVLSHEMLDDGSSSVIVLCTRSSATQDIDCCPVAHQQLESRRTALANTRSALVTAQAPVCSFLHMCTRAGLL